MCSFRRCFRGLVPLLAELDTVSSVVTILPFQDFFSLSGFWSAHSGVSCHGFSSEIGSSCRKAIEHCGHWSLNLPDQKLGFQNSTFHFIGHLSPSVSVVRAPTNRATSIATDAEKILRQITHTWTWRSCQLAVFQSIRITHQRSAHHSTDVHSHRCPPL